MDNKPNDYRASMKDGEIVIQREDHPLKLKYQLVIVALTTLVIMTLYEFLKQIIFPNITIWGSHLITIFFTSFLATIASFFIFKKLSTAYRKIVDEITERKMAENALMQSRDTLSSILSASPIAIGLVENRVFRWVNEEMISMFKFESEEYFKGQEIEHLYASKDEYRRIDKEIDNKLKTGKPAAVDVMLKRQDGSTFIGHVKVSSQNPSNPMERAVFTISDISWRKQVEEEKEKLITKLQTALQEVKSLRGIIPICSKCKKVRDDEGYWQQVEKYIQDRSEAEFSHGICHQCAKKLYPEIEI